MRHWLVPGGLAAAMAMPAAGLQAQAYPLKAVSLIVPYTPGGAADTLGRIVASSMSRNMGAPFVVENRGGAGGIIGSELAARSAPDGHTLIVSGLASHILAPFAAPAQFDPIASFTHIALFGGPPAGLILHPSVPARNVKEFIAFVKSNPKGLSYASPGIGTHGHLVGELFSRHTGINLVHVPYKGGAQAIADLVAGHVLAGLSTVVPALPMVRAGKARFLAFTAEHRLGELPDVPTFAELGFPELSTTTWFGLSGPAGMSRPVVNRLNAQARSALQQPEVIQQLAAEGIEPNNLDASMFTAFFIKEIERWGPLAKVLGSKP